MSRKDVDGGPKVGPRSAASAAALLVAVFGLGQSSGQPEPPATLPDAAAERDLETPGRNGFSNFVLVIIDALRTDRLATYGHHHDTAPFLSEFAERSVVFEHAYSSSSWTAPAMASIFTSTYPSQHQLHTGYFVARRAVGQTTSRLNRIPDSLFTLPEMLKRQGYRTFGVADNPNICEKMGFSRGFDRFVSYDYRGAAAVNAAVDELAQEILEPDSPYFLYVHYMDPHSPYGRREAHYDDEASGGELFANYDSEIGYTDAHLRVLLERLHAGPDTLVIVTSDHGEEFQDHGSHGHKNQLYDELLHVPLMISWPNRLAPRRVAHNVSTIDLVPTVFALLKLDPFEQSMGIPLIPSMDATRSAQRPLFAMRRSEQWRQPPTRKAVIWQHWKYIWSMPSGHRELYDRSADPDERRNVHEQRREISRDLHQRLLRFEKNARVYERSYSAPAELSDELKEKLRAIGYAEE